MKQKNIGEERLKNAKEKFSQCTLILGQNNKLYPPKGIFRSDKETEQLFKKVDSSLEFAHITTSDNLLDLVPPFDLSKAIDLLENIDFSKVCQQDPEKKLSIDIIAWFADPKFRDEFGQNQKLSQQFANLEIIPTGRELKMLNDVDMPGSFEDPLKIASIIDMQHLQPYREFLETKGARPLTLTSYAGYHVPKVFESEIGIPDSAMQELVLMLSSRLSELQDDQGVLWKLEDCPLVECTDGKFRTADKVYFDKKDIRNVLGNSIPLAKRDLSERVHDFYKWLGVKDQATPQDLLHRIEQIISEPPTPINRSHIQKIFEYVAQRWTNAEDRENLEEELQALKTLKWLPAERDNENWHPPQGVYTAFRKYLFDSQGLFLDIPYRVQPNAESDFGRFFNIPTEPSVNHVVKHLLFCMEQNIPVNKEVYVFLNINSDDGTIKQLQDQACLLTNNETYIKPNHAFWGKHGFGDYRFSLSDDWRKYTNLLKCLGVKDVPNSGDAIEVLQEVSKTLIASLYFCKK